MFLTLPFTGGGGAKVGYPTAGTVIMVCDSNYVKDDKMASRKKNTHSYLGQGRQLGRRAR